MTYPLSDHYDGTLFFNPEPTIRRSKGRRFGLASILRARLRRDPTVWSAWPEHIENRAYPKPDGPVPPGKLDLTFIGHSSFLLRFAGFTIISDPVFSKRCSPISFAGPARVRDPGLSIADLPPIDVIILSHNHYDHCDIASLRKLNRRFPNVKIITSLGNAAFLKAKGLSGAIELDWWESTEIGGCAITLTPARHFAARSLWDRNKTLWAGMMIKPPAGPTTYFAGDTGYTRFFTEIRDRLGAPDVALLPIGAYEPRWFMGPVHMNPADAVKAFADLGAKQAVGMHFGTFQLTAEPIDAPERDLAMAKAGAGIPSNIFVTLDVGETSRL